MLMMHQNRNLVEKYENKIYEITSSSIKFEIEKKDIVFSLCQLLILITLVEINIKIILKSFHLLKYKMRYWQKWIMQVIWMMNSLKLRQFEVRKSETHFLSERKYGGLLPRPWGSTSSALRNHFLSTEARVMEFLEFLRKSAGYPPPVLRYFFCGFF